LITILTGDALATLRMLPDNSAHCCVTSPPYFGLRDYQVEGQMGLEASPDEFVDALVGVFREVRRVLRHDGTCWLVLGDSYAANRSYQVSDSKHPSHDFGRSNAAKVPHGLKPKDLLMIPARVALALQADGWYLRSDIIWAKNNPMPESAKDRPTSAHEHVLLLTKCETYFYDNEAVKEKAVSDKPAGNRYDRTERISRGGPGKDAPWSGVGGTRNARNVWPIDQPLTHEHILLLTKEAQYFYDQEAVKEPATGTAHDRGTGVHPKANDGFGIKQNASFSAAVTQTVETRNARSVWNINTAPYKGAHFATFPAELARRCIAAGTSACGGCAACGAPFKRVMEKGEPDLEHQRRSGGDAQGEYAGQGTKDYKAAGAQNASDVKRRILAGMVQRRTVAWVKTCQCSDAYPLPAVVLDPFMGAGTTGLVAERLNRDCIGIELSPESVALATERIRAEGGKVV
jgi:DNA modification methylase